MPLKKSLANFSYKVVLTQKAKKDIDRLDPVTQKRIGKKLSHFLNSKDPLEFAERLIASEVGTYRFRVGDYRLAFDVVDHTITILRIRHRREIYR